MFYFRISSKGGGRRIPRVERTFPGRRAGEVKTANRTTRASAVKFYYVFGEKILQKISKIVIFL